LKRLSLFILLFIAGMVCTHYLTDREKNQALKDDDRKNFSEEEERKTDQPGQFLLFHRGIRTRDGEEMPEYASNYMWRELRHARTNEFARQRKSGRIKFNGVVAWTERGPGNVPGRTRALFNLPDQNDDTWLAGAATGGIWHTANGGLTWSERSSDFPALPISCFAADASASIIYAGTGEFVSSVYSAIGNGIFKSIDSGLTWTQLTSTNDHPDFSIITRLIVNPSDPNTLLASTVPHNMSQDNTSAIMRSTDGGASWTKVKEITGFFEQIIATPGNFNVQYASQNSVGLWKSTDGGVTWGLSNNGMDPSGRMEIAISPVNANRIFVSAEGSVSGGQSDLYYSSNGGATWSLIDISFDGNIVDFLEGQGFYDNTIMCDPFDENRFYFGGVSLFRTTLGSGSVQVDNFQMEEVNTQSFLFLQSFGSVVHDDNRLTVGAFHNNITVEIRFGAGESQMAHRFTVPTGATTGVAAGDYTYNDYVSVPFEVWDVTNNQQLMVSFRDQNRNNKFDLVTSGLQSPVPPLQQSREYIFIHRVTYNASLPNESIDQAGGQEYRLMYNFFPAQAANTSWNEATLPASKLIIKNSMLQKFNATTVTVADGRGDFDEKNSANQVDLQLGVHPDHHAMIPVIVNQSSKTFKILIGNDGGIFVSKPGTNPGITEGDWEFRGFGLNTSQFYGADKKPGKEQYVGGMQDNGTRYSPNGEVASPQSKYLYGLGGDGFEVLWHSRDPDKILGSGYNGDISRTLNCGKTWQEATTGLTPGSPEFPFVTKLAHSKDLPDRVFTVGRQGVYVSNNFGGSWQLTPISQKFVSSTGSGFFLDVEVSRANANIVWAGTGMFNSGTIRKLHVSTDGGKTFNETNNFTTVPLGNITKLASHPTEENTAYALFSFAHAPKILRTTDLGQSWQDISGFGTGTTSVNGFPDVAVYSLYVHTDNPDILWAGTEIGIVESLDNGQTWALISDFPNVSVWDMKGQDHQIIMATHGRGIWTATTSSSQNNINIPQITAAGTAPKKTLNLRIQSPATFDSVEIFIGSSIVRKLFNVVPGIQELGLANITPGYKQLKLLCYRGATPFQSAMHKVNHHEILPPRNAYSTYFTTIEDLYVDGLTPESFVNLPVQPRKSLQTDHSYTVDKIYEVMPRTPVVVSNKSSILYYGDVAIIEPGQDSIIVEATKNGLDWINLKSAYDSEYAGDVKGLWKNAYTNETEGTSVMVLQHEIDLREKFTAEDSLLFRWRMFSNPSITSWGWAVDYIAVQEPPVAVNRKLGIVTLSLFPNPTRDEFTMEYELKTPSPVSVMITDSFGRRMIDKQLGLKNGGIQRQVVDVNGLQAGSYVVILTTDKGKMISKLIKQN
jgi:photosystem II stability/assembly factor-like uncharacterized protein